MRITFIQMPVFESAWRRMRLSDVDLSALEAEIAKDPEAPPLMRGTGGVRKIRFAPPSWQRGKSGATRVCYAYFARFAQVYLFLIFSKDKKGNVTAFEAKTLHGLMKRIEQLLDERGVA